MSGAIRGHTHREMADTVDPTNPTFESGTEDGMRSILNAYLESPRLSPFVCLEGGGTGDGGVVAHQG